MKTTNTPAIVQITIDQATRLLDASKVDYIVRLADGTLITKGDMTLAPTKMEADRKRRSRKVPHGTFTRAYKSDIHNMQVGDVLCLYRTPTMLTLGVTLADVQGTCSTIASAAFGNNAHKIHINTTTDCVEILRTA